MKRGNQYNVITVVTKMSKIPVTSDVVPLGPKLKQLVEESFLAPALNRSNKVSQLFRYPRKNVQK